MQNKTQWCICMHLHVHVTRSLTFICRWIPRLILQHATMNSTTINMGVWVSLQYADLHSLDLKRDISGS